jgi:hypothetical protein
MTETLSKVVAQMRQSLAAKQKNDASHVLGAINGVDTARWSRIFSLQIRKGRHAPCVMT